MRRDSSLETFLRKRTANKISFRAGRDAVSLTFATSLIDLNRSIINQKVNQSLKFFFVNKAKIFILLSVRVLLHLYLFEIWPKLQRFVHHILILQTTFPLPPPPPPSFNVTLS